MPHFRLARYRAKPFHRRLDRRLAAWLESLARGFARILLALGAGLLLLFPVVWAGQRTRLQAKDWTYPHLSLVDGMERRWKQYPAPPAFVSGGEPQVRDYLARWPEVWGLQARSAPKRLWVRDGAVLVRVRADQDPRLSGWFAHAAPLEPGSAWSPPPALDPEGARRPKTILAGENWLVLKRWDIGSIAAESILRDLSATPPMIRLALLPSPARPSLAQPSEPWAAGSIIQIDAHGVAATRWWTEGVVTNFGEEWTFYAVPGPALARRIRSYHRVQFFWGALLSLLAASMGVLLWARRNRRLKAKELEAERLAALTHSLKTPLSVLKMRCDLLRLNPEEPNQLLELSEDVDRLTSTIDNGLRLFKESHLGGTGRFREALGTFWFEEMAGEMDASFRGQGREIDLVLCEGAAWASPATLHVALQTALENSLQHGEGSTLLRTALEGGRLIITIEDQGRGLTREDFRNLSQASGRAGTPFAKGLGLSLLARIAEDEGWGIDLHTREGAGFRVVVQVPAAPAHLLGGEPPC
jgi:signal transduction histidine kinase